MKHTCCRGEFSCQTVRYVNPAYAHLYPEPSIDASEASLEPEKEREPLLTRFKNVMATAMHEAGLRYSESSQVL